MTNYPGAYAFESDLDLPAMRLALDRVGHSWRLCDSDGGGLYLSLHPGDGVRLRIFPREARYDFDAPNDGKYVLDIMWLAREPNVMPRADLEAIVQRDVLAVVGARAVAATQTWD